MNPNTGHVVSSLALMKEGQLYERLPSDLQPAAQRLLRGREEAHVPLSSRGSLSKWAAGRRRARRDMQKKSRRQNRS